MRQKYAHKIDSVEFDVIADNEVSDMVMDILETGLTGEPLKTIRVYPNSRDLELLVMMLKATLLVFAKAPFRVWQFGHKNRLECPDTSLYSAPYEGLSLKAAQEYAAEYTKLTIYFVVIVDAQDKIIGYYKDGKPL